MAQVKVFSLGGIGSKCCCGSGAPCNIKICVLGAPCSGDSITGASVTIKSGGTTIASGTTGGDGCITLGFPAGTYTVLITKTGYNNFSTSATLACSNTYTYTLTIDTTNYSEVCCGGCNVIVPNVLTLTGPVTCTLTGGGTTWEGCDDHWRNLQFSQCDLHGAGGRGNGDDSSAFCLAMRYLVRLCSGYDIPEMHGWVLAHAELRKHSLAIHGFTFMGWMRRCVLCYLDDLLFSAMQRWDMRRNIVRSIYDNSSTIQWRSGLLLQRSWILLAWSDDVHVHNHAVTWEEALDIMVKRRNAPRFRELCDESYPDHLAWRQTMLTQAALPENEVQYPPITTQVITAAQALARFVGSGLATVEPEEHDRRMGICQVCPEFEPDDNRCRKCGCYLAVKPWVARESCPIGKW